MNTLFITHNDMDGIAGYIVNKCLNITFDKSISISYTANIDNYLNNYKEITCVDIVPFTEEKYLELIKIGKIIKIYDHHLSNEWVKKYPNAVINTSKCGAKVYFDSIKNDYKNEYLENYLDIVNDFDMWNTKTKYFELSVSYDRVFKGLTKLSFHITELDKYNGYSNYIGLILDKFEKKFKDTTELERDLINKARANERKEFIYIKHNIKFGNDSNNNRYGYISLFIFSEYVIHKILELFDDIKYIIICRRGIISVRSLDFDITTLKYINGHKFSGGARLPNSEINKILSGELKL